MIEHIRELIARYSRKGILIDTNILLLYFIGSFDPGLISSFKRTARFSVEDYETLLILVSTTVVDEYIELHVVCNDIAWPPLGACAASLTI